MVKLLSQSGPGPCNTSVMTGVVIGILISEIFNIVLSIFHTVIWRFKRSDVPESPSETTFDNKTITRIFVMCIGLCKIVSPFLTTEVFPSKGVSKYLTITFQFLRK